VSRLLVFGCSLTYGEGLKDCWENYRPSNTPSKLAWPNLVGENLNKEVFNFSIPGASNKLIWYTVLNTEIKKTDLVIILWTSPDRYCFFKDNKSSIRILPSDLNRKFRSNHKMTNFYYKRLYSNFDSQIDTYNRINYINYYFNSKNIKNYHFIEKSFFNNNCEPFWNEAKILGIEFDYNLGLALDNLHPSQEAHKDLSKTILKNIE